MKKELILSVAGEGGDIQLFGRREGQQWFFWSNRNEGVLADLLNEEDRKLLNSLHASKELGHNLKEALAGLGRCWHRLHPLYVHPVFSFDIFQVLREKDVLFGHHISPKWKRVIFEKNPVYTVAQMIQRAQHLVVLTGAGMSMDSGLRDFWSAAAWWRKVDPRTFATVEAMYEYDELFDGFFRLWVEKLHRVRPHQGHYVLNKWEQRGQLKRIVTQNVDGLHQLAGNRNVEELHGSIQSCCCQLCGKQTEQAFFLKRERCACGGLLRPNVVLIGENLPKKAWERSIQAMKMADVILVIGTNLEVFPVNQLPLVTNGKRILINKDSNEISLSFDTVIEGTSLDILMALDRWVGHLSKDCRRG